MPQIKTPKTTFRLAKLMDLNDQKIWVRFLNCLPFLKEGIAAEALSVLEPLRFIIGCLVGN